MGDAIGWDERLREPLKAPQSLEWRIRRGGNGAKNAVTLGRQFTE